MKNAKRILSLLIAVMMLFALTACKGKEDNKKDPAPSKTEKTTAPYKGELIMATTTSTDDTGLLDVLKPLFREQTGWDLKWVAVGTGAAIKLGQDGEADVLLVHAKASEEEFIAQGYGVERFEVMYNDFIIVGPKDGKIKKTDKIEDVFKQILNEKLIFISRGDDSGTHKKELAVWSALNLKPEANKNYISAGSGMADTITMAIEKSGYCLTDRATWLATEDKSNFDVICEGDSNLKNQYGVIAVSPEKYPDTNIDGANAFIKWICSEETQKVINKFGVDKYGKQLFFANAKK